MEKLFLLMTALLCSSLQASAEKVYKTYVKDGRTVYYCQDEGLTVTFDPYDGNGFSPYIGISYDGEEEFLFNPEDIVAYTYRVPKVRHDQRYHSRKFVECGVDVDRLEKDTLPVLPYAQYRKKISRKSFWEMLASNMVDAAGTSLAMKSGDDTEAYIQRDKLELRNDERAFNRAEQLRLIDEDYWRANTIFPGTYHLGYINIKHKKTDYLHVVIPVNGDTYEFDVFM